MIEKTEWEIVEEASPGARAEAGASPRPTLRAALQALLGRWWRWKIAGATVIGALALLVFAALAGVVVLAVAVCVIASIVIGTIRQRLAGKRAVGPFQMRHPWR